MNLPAHQFQAVQEPEAFLKLFPQQFDFIYAEHPDPGDRPEWKTEDRQPLSDRLLQEGAYTNSLSTRYRLRSPACGFPLSKGD